ncbi:baseplate J/gp47 family protein [Halomonas cerina]|uniref:Baseplate protein J-like domain-containing protein n=1 Tax=Halomonas cerina TaxID=447424 RepID=A0A839VHI8_9GAMM|nr:baseplate J/gp47 family protein [Halomonas cerina]MBB3191866.1 hypothetical protein [Halomonas cerina]
MENHRRIDPEVLRHRAENLGSGLNGLRLVFVDLLPAGAPVEARLRLEFFNTNKLADIVTDVQNDILAPHEVFTITGGSRLKGGDKPGNVRVTDVQAHTSDTLELTVAPIGDYSTYTLTAYYEDAGSPVIDPLLASVEFKFRPGCFNLNCAPDWEAPEPPGEQPDIDYLARDFHSFKHNLINAMRDRVPGWAPTSETDLDQVIIDLLAADGDELADYQDRVMNEAYLGRARKRVSLARHARLMDYHIHQGNQASTYLVAEVSADVTVPARFGVWSGEAWDHDRSVVFITQDAKPCHPELNPLQLYTWDGAVIALDTGAIQADLALPAPLNPAVKADAQVLADLLQADHVQALILEQALNPETGTVNGVDKQARQLLRLREGDAAARVVADPVAGVWFVRVFWREEDALKQRYCFVTDCPGQPPIETVSLFRGNVLQASHGRPYNTTFRPPGQALGFTKANQFEYEDEAYYEVTPWGALCTLPNGPLAYRATQPGGDVPPRTTLSIDNGGMLVTAVSVDGAAWGERIDLIESDGGDAHYMVETDELGASRLRFGSNGNGRELPEDAVVECRYQVGRGSEGNVGPDSLTGFDAGALALLQSLRNPFDVTDGRDPEPAEEIIRRAPEAYRARQLRAVTLEDYVDQAVGLADVSHAQARYGWTGSWRTVRVAIDPAGTDTFTEDLRRRVHRQLDAVRLIGEDLEIRGAQYVGLDIQLHLCAHPQYWIEDLAAELEMRFSDGYLPDGSLAFFHPDRWTFGQPLHASQLIGAALEVQGVERVLTASLRRLDAGAGSGPTVIIDPEDMPLAEVEHLPVDDFEVLRVANDPSHLERGRITFDIRGGRQ